MFADARWPPCSLTSPRRLGDTTRTLTRKSGARFSRLFIKFWKYFNLSSLLIVPRNISSMPPQGLVYLREAGCTEGGAGCKYDSSCSAETWQVRGVFKYSKMQISLFMFGQVGQPPLPHQSLLRHLSTISLLPLHSTYQFSINNQSFTSFYNVYIFHFPLSLSHINISSFDLSAFNPRAEHGHAAQVKSTTAAGRNSSRTTSTMAPSLTQ